MSSCSNGEPCRNPRSRSFQCMMYAPSLWPRSFLARRRISTNREYWRSSPELLFKTAPSPAYESTSAPDNFPQPNRHGHFSSLSSCVYSLSSGAYGMYVSRPHPAEYSFRFSDIAQISISTNQCLVDGSSAFHLSFLSRLSTFPLQFP